MKLAFFGYYKSFDYFRIGGTDSFIRRLTYAIISINKKFKVEYVLYGDKNKEISINKNLKLIYKKDFYEALRYLEKKEFNHVITTWLLLKHRKEFYNFFKQKKLNTIFHNLIFFYPNTFLKKVRKIYELIFFKNNGKNFVVSERQKKFFKFFTKNIVMLPPPVDCKYFIERNYNLNHKIKITFLGRIDPRKGIDKVIKIFEKINNNSLFETMIYGIHIKEDKVALKMHNYLKNQKKVKYVEIEREYFSEKIDNMVINVLKNTDIFVQPYRNLDSTVDTPLLILEAMAAGCVILSTKISSVISIYGNSDFLLDYSNFEYNAIDFLKNLTKEKLLNERMRIQNKKKELLKIYESHNVAKRFLDELNKRNY